MTRVLVTGCAGFIGSHLVDRLLQGDNDVIGIDCLTDHYPEEQKLANLSRALKHEGFILIRQDILEMDRFPRSTGCFTWQHSQAFGRRGARILQLTRRTT